jgi:hypothetical protein
VAPHNPVSHSRYRIIFPRSHYTIDIIVSVIRTGSNVQASLLSVRNSFVARRGCDQLLKPTQSYLIRLAVAPSAMFSWSIFLVLTAGNVVFGESTTVCWQDTPLSSDPLTCYSSHQVNLMFATTLPLLYTYQQTPLSSLLARPFKAL